jgi:F1F0 ATPase subunit 2
MTMAQTAFDLLSGAGLGLVTGLFFFGCLWLTVRRLGETAHPHRWLFLSFIGRAAVVLGVFYVLAEKGPAMVIAAAAGFLVARVGLVRYVAPNEHAAR